MHISNDFLMQTVINASDPWNLRDKGGLSKSPSQEPLVYELRTDFPVNKPSLLRRALLELLFTARKSSEIISKVFIL